MTAHVQLIGNQETPEYMCSCADWAPVRFEDWLRYPQLFGSWPYQLDGMTADYLVPLHGSEIDPSCPIHGE
jgi:hypothetical protein